MNSGPGRIWWRGDHTRLNKRWRCSLAFISKSILDRHHQNKLKLKFNLCLSNVCHQNFQNIVTWGVEWRSRKTIFACIPMESLFSGVLPPNTHKKQQFPLFKWLSESEWAWDFFKLNNFNLRHWCLTNSKLKMHFYCMISKRKSLKTGFLYFCQFHTML